MERAPLTRSRHDRMIAGVCAGLANHLGVPVVWVRIGMAFAVFLGGSGAVFYLWLFATVPAEGESEPVVPLRQALTSVRIGSPTAGVASEEQAGPEPDEAPRRRLPIAEFVFGGALLIVGVAIALVHFGVGINLGVLLPGLAVLVGLGLTWWLIADREHPEKHLLPRVLASLALVAVGVLMFFVMSDEPSVLTVIGAALAVLAGVAFAVAPWLLRINRELVAERSARARESERAEIAAHLHDSVLQTLALIQQRSDPSTEAAKLARIQEKELRQWLFRTADGAPDLPRDTVDAELRTHADELETIHDVRFEVISVGERVVAPEAIVAASREAMLNAARHAGGDVTVYIETTATAISVDVSDRGPGFELSEIVESRLGVRESILGRMERAGGSANILKGPGGQGVSVRLEQPRASAQATDPKETP